MPLLNLQTAEPTARLEAVPLLEIQTSPWLETCTLSKQVNNVHCETNSSYTELEKHTWINDMRNEARRCACWMAATRSRNVDF